MAGILDIQGNIETKGGKSPVSLENRNFLRCKLLGKKRITNKSYLRKRLSYLGISEVEFRQFYLSEEARLILQKALRAEKFLEVAEVLRIACKAEPSYDNLRKLYSHNGRNSLFLAYLDKYVKPVWTAPTRIDDTFISGLSGEFGQLETPEKNPAMSGA